MKSKINIFSKDDQRIVEEVKDIKVICFDIDDTISTNGKLTSEAYAALWELKNNGYKLVPVTGRPAAWCDHIIRFWPVDAVIGENGAFAFFMQNGKRARLNTFNSDHRQEKARIESLKQDILKKFPEAKWASDQDYREYDLAIDFCEDVPRWSEQKIQDLMKFLKETKNLQAKISSIHINTWFGKHDKESGIKFWIENGALGLGLKEVPPWGEWIFIGDSPNDAPMFKAFDKSIGVANLNNFLDKLNHFPTWITKSESGSGFCEFKDVMIVSGKKF